jgi:hypothetical protein
MVVVASRAVFKLQVEGQNEAMHFNDPTAAATAALVTAGRFAGPLLDSFLNAGGLPAVVRTLRESSCSVTLLYTVDLIEGLVGEEVPSGEPNHLCELAERCFESGG